MIYTNYFVTYQKGLKRRKQHSRKEDIPWQSITIAPIVGVTHLRRRFRVLKRSTQILKEGLEPI